jgi:hemoglobin-like flavoprotein
MDAAALTRSVELVAERGDPAPLVYARLFAAYPEMEALFFRDTNGNIRGNMLAEAITALMDFAGANNYGGNLFRAEIVNHEHLGVPPANFLTFFSVMRDVFREMLGAEWTPAFDTAWGEVLSAVHSSLVIPEASEAAVRDPGLTR